MDFSSGDQVYVKNEFFLLVKFYKYTHGRGEHIKRKWEKQLTKWKEFFIIYNLILENL